MGVRGYACRCLPLLPLAPSLGSTVALEMAARARSVPQLRSKWLLEPAWEPQWRLLPLDGGSLGSAVAPEMAARARSVLLEPVLEPHNARHGSSRLLAPNPQP